MSAVESLHKPIKNVFVIHRDIKSENILVNIESSGEIMIKLADFGSAKFLEVGGEPAKGDDGVTKCLIIKLKLLLISIYYFNLKI